MRVRIAFACALAAALAAAAPAGALDPQQAGLQVALRAQGLYLGPIDAIVGPRTRAAVSAFQRTQGLPVTGKVDARTRLALGPLGRHLFGTRQLGRGSFGWDVAVLQFLLDRHGLKVPVNGYLDAPTLRGLRAFQRSSRLAVDGVGGPRTFAALRGTPLRARARARVVTTATHPYVVKPGDSLTSIARGAGISLGKLARLNRVDPARVLLIGTRLRIPGRPAVVRTERTAEVVPETTSAISVRASLDRWAAHYGIDPSLAHALAWMESGYNNTLVSSVGAQGVMQLLPSTWDYVETVLIGHPVAHDADGNVEVGLAYLRHLLQAFHGNESLALAAWYQGERSVREAGPLQVTTTFVANVLALQRRM
ncbi:MAG TPA: peptidoglycan-binding protein [Gaiellaceae bacterium]|nr:peptidoglycan-binding protein [Gaiellaceae bacterium]